MARWKLSRQNFGTEEFMFLEGDEVTVGRGINNTITLASIVVSRNHCVINVQQDQVLITDLKSSNGIYVGLKKIPQNIPYPLTDSDVIGIGWTIGAPIANITDKEKYMFKLIKENTASITNRIQFQSDNELDDIEAEVAAFSDSRPSNVSNERSISPILQPKPHLKRKLDILEEEIKMNEKDYIPEIIKRSRIVTLVEDIINISDSDHEKEKKKETSIKQVKLEPISDEPQKQAIEEDIINISDSDQDVPKKQKKSINNSKQLISEEPQEQLIKEEPLKVEKEDLEYDAFNVKQEYLCYDDEAIQCDSDSDSESEHWLLRLSQSSPGKPFTKVAQESKCMQHMKPVDSSYSQVDDYIDLGSVSNAEEDFEDDLITIPPSPKHDGVRSESTSYQHDEPQVNDKVDDPVNVDEEDLMDDLISFKAVPDTAIPQTSVIVQENSKDDTDGFNCDIFPKELEKSSTAVVEPQVEKSKRTQMIAPLVQLPRKKHVSIESRPKTYSSKSRKHKKHSSSKRHISNSQKEERKKKLKELASKEKEQKSKRHSSSSSKLDKAVTNVKVTTTNRGAFLTDVIQGVVKPMKRKDSPQKPIKQKTETSPRENPKENDPNSSDYIENKKRLSDKSKDDKKSKLKNKNETLPKENPKENNPESLDYIKNKQRLSDKSKDDKKSKYKNKNETSPIENPKENEPESSDYMENKKRLSDKSKDNKKSKHKNKNEKEDCSRRTSSRSKSQISSNIPDSRVPLKNLKPLTESEEFGKPCSKVEPLAPKKVKKNVSFALGGPKVHVFEIVEGNKMKKTSLAKTLAHVQQKPVFSLEKITLMKILRWNPQWLEEQKNTNDPPPILGHNNPPMTIFHSFNSHSQYIQLVGDLLLMEIWECLTQGYMRTRNQTNGLQMRIASLPPVPPQERYFELFNISVDVSLPTSEIRNIPRVGEVMHVFFGPENAKCQRFFFVHNVRCLPSPPNNIHSFFNISLHSCFKENMKMLRPGEVLIGRRLAYINKELTLFEAMEYLAGSQLHEAILRPNPRHYIKCDPTQSMNNITQWTKTLNPSQHAAVSSSVSAALGDRPSIQMVQGPPGTGKSSVICAIVMSYFYDLIGRLQHNRGKVLICATSNAAVDELIIRLLHLRKDLPKSERFRMVRVGRAEAMHPRALDVSSQQLAARELAARRGAEPSHPGINEEISHLEAKINMWKTQAQDAKDPVRVAYCQDRVKQLAARIGLLRGGAGGGVGGGAGGGERHRAEQLAEVERRIVQGAHIVVTTLSSVHNLKMRGLKGRIALCIVDEAGQAIEPETLLPLTLDVTHLTLIGDPQQLPGFICSQRAKKHGLGESLFSRLTSSAETWLEGTPAVLLNQQYRMHIEIADYPNRAFYDNKIQTMAPARADICVPPYSIVCISSGDKGQGASGANEMEAWGVSRLVLALSAAVRACGLSLAVITPYNAHKDLIKKYLRMLQDPGDANVEVNTVDSFQGQERDVVVVSLARSQGMGFLSDTGRMNVMLTRARIALLVCLNPHAIIKNHQWRTLVEDAQRRNMYKVLPNKLCQPTTAAQIPGDDILKYITCHKPSN